MKKEKQTQEDKFKEAARDLETDNDEKRFDETLGKVAKTRPQKQLRPPEGSQ